jgi:hypothetical protein
MTNQVDWRAVVVVSLNVVREMSAMDLTEANLKGEEDGGMTWLIWSEVEVVEGKD